MFELAALGLLLHEPLHGYRLKQQLEQFMSGCISVNYGTIYPMLRRLEQRRAIAIVGSGASTRKLYSLTELGQALWLEKMMEQPRESWVNARSRFMIKVFFFSDLAPAQRLQLLDQRLLTCQLRRASPPWPSTPSDPFQVQLWHHCNQRLEAEISWLQQVREIHAIEVAASPLLPQSTAAGHSPACPS
jgi:DNA-binding PadR family transcriptional regulator